MKFVEAAGGSGDDEARELASDIYVRTDRLIPFLPVSKIASARERWLEVEPIADSSALDAPPDPIDPFLADVQEVAAADLPAQPASLALQRLRGELESLAAGAAFDPPEDGFWPRWRKLEAELERAETKVLGRLSQQLRPEYPKWLKQRSSVLDKYEKSATDELRALSQQLDRV